MSKPSGLYPWLRIEPPMYIWLIREKPIHGYSHFCMGSGRKADDHRRLLPESIQLDVALPIELSAVYILPIQFPGHLSEKETRLEQAHVLPNTPTRTHRKGLERRLEIRIESRVVVRVRRWKPSLRAEVARPPEIALRVRGCEDGCLDPHTSYSK